MQSSSFLLTFAPIPTAPSSLAFQTTFQDVFLPRQFTAGGAYGASVVDVCAGTILWALQCTNATTVVSPTDLETLTTTRTGPASLCGTNAPVVTVTDAMSHVAVTAYIPSISATVYESCVLPGNWVGTCVAVSTMVGKGTTTTTAHTTTFTGFNNPDWNVYVICYPEAHVQRLTLQVSCRDHCGRFETNKPWRL